MTRMLFKTILCPTDFSPLGNAALPYALLLASVFRSKLVLFHVMRGEDRLFGIPSSSLAKSWCRDELSRLLKQTSKRLGEHLPIELGEVAHVIEEGPNPARRIVEQVTGCAADLLVMATHGSSGLKRELLGSVCEHVIVQSACPVLALRTSPSTTDALLPSHLNVRRVLVPTDLSANSLRAIALASVIAKPFHATLTVLYVTQKADTDAARAALEQFVSLNLTPTTPLTFLAHSGDPADQIVACAAHRNTDLIAMTTQGHNQLRDRLFGSTTERVLRHAPCPLLVIK